MPTIRPLANSRQPVRSSEPVAPSDPVSQQLRQFESAVVSIQTILTSLAASLAESGNPRPQQQAAQGFGKLRAVIARLGGKI